LSIPLLTNRGLRVRILRLIMTVAYPRLSVKVGRILNREKSHMLYLPSLFRPDRPCTEHIHANSRRAGRGTGFLKIIESKADRGRAKEPTGLSGYRLIHILAHGIKQIVGSVAAIHIQYQQVDVFKSLLSNFEAAFFSIKGLESVVVWLEQRQVVASSITHNNRTAQTQLVLDESSLGTIPMVQRMRNHFNPYQAICAEKDSKIIWDHIR